jgi:hypothetical protein
MTTAMTTTGFEEALGQLEQELLTPVVPGELEGWFDRVGKSAERVSSTMWSYTESLFNSEYPEIAEQDASLLGQVEQLMREDTACLDQFAGFLDQLAQLRRMAPKCEPNEAIMRNSLEAFIQQGLSWVMAAKRQQKARETWFAESLYRVRGGGD